MTRGQKLELSTENYRLLRWVAVRWQSSILCAFDQQKKMCSPSERTVRTVDQSQ